MINGSGAFSKQCRFSHASKAVDENRSRLFCSDKSVPRRSRSLQDQYTFWFSKIRAQKVLRGSTYSLLTRSQSQWRHVPAFDSHARLMQISRSSPPKQTKSAQKGA